MHQEEIHKCEKCAWMLGEFYWNIWQNVPEVTAAAAAVFHGESLCHAVSPLFISSPVALSLLLLTHLLTSAECVCVPTWPVSSFPISLAIYLRLSPPSLCCLLLAVCSQQIGLKINREKERACVWEREKREDGLLKSLLFTTWNGFSSQSHICDLLNMSAKYSLHQTYFLCSD